MDKTYETERTQAEKRGICARAYVYMCVCARARVCCLCGCKAISGMMNKDVRRGVGEEEGGEWRSFFFRFFFYFAKFHPRVAAHRNYISPTYPPTAIVLALV